MLFPLLALGTALLLALSVGLLLAHHASLAGAVSQVSDDTRFVVRIDPPVVPRTVRIVLLATCGLGVIGVGVPWWGWTPETIQPWLAVSWLLAIGATGLGVAAYQAGWLWRAPSRRLGLSPDVVWWDAVDASVRPDLGPTSVHRSIPRATTTVTFDGAYAVFANENGDGVAFGPVPESTRMALQTRWEG
ncbi:MAG: hypothetical protein AAGA48_13040 [Myxococcota bacterium]